MQRGGEATKGQVASQALGVARPAIDELKAKVQAEIDRRGEDIVRVAPIILQHPEPGFREHYTARLVGCCEYCV